MSDLHKLQSFLDAQAKIVIALVFGSFASGTETDKSDIDIGIAQMDVMTAEDKVSLLNAISLLMNREVDIVDLRTATGTVQIEAITRGKLLINRDEALWVQIIGKALRDEEDFQKKRREINRQHRKKVFST